MAGTFCSCDCCCGRNRSRLHRTQVQFGVSSEEKIGNKVFVVTARLDDFCSAEFPYFYQVENGSDKTVRNVKFSVEINRTGFPSVLNGYTSIDADSVLKPGQGGGGCFRAQKKDYTGMLSEKDVEINVVYKDVTFSD